MKENLEIKNIQEELKEAYLDYALSVIISRALPDVRDGLKPVQRRILYTMYEMGIFPGAGFRKSATIVGGVMGRYHPHGDQPIYEAMARMAQDFSLRYPLIEGQGNWGSIDGDPPAAQRYTEARLSKIGKEMLKDIEKETVEWEWNFDATRKEPKILPTPLPQLLMNGSFGIAVGMATNIPPHNLAELCDALLLLLRKENASLDEIMEFLKGPDFPTGGICFSQKEIKEAYRTGKGKIFLRAKVRIEKEGGKNQIIIEEIPYGVLKSSLVEEIANLVKEKKIEGIRDIKDLSGREGTKVVIFLKKETNPHRVLNYLFEKTSLQKTFNINMVALEGVQPRVFSLKELLLSFLDFRREIVRKAKKFELKKTKERIHILEGLKKAIDNISKVISLIRRSLSREDAKRKLKKEFKFSEIQAETILKMPLEKLPRLEREKILKELKEKKELARKLEEILSSKKGIDREIQKEIEEIKEKFGDKRRTLILKTPPQKLKEIDLLPKEENILVLSKGGFVKRLPLKDFRLQKKGGIGEKLFQKEKVEHILLISSHDEILFFTDKGKVYSIKAYLIPLEKKESLGKGISHFLSLGKDEKITAVFPKKEGGFLLMITKKGLVKKTSFDEFRKIKRSGILCTSLEKNDELLLVRETSGKDLVGLISSDGSLIIFKEKEIKKMGRKAKGYLGKKLKKDEEIVGAFVTKNLEGYLLTITENGFAKMTPLSDFKIQKRGGKGIECHKLSSKTGKLKKAFLVKDQKELLLMTEKGKTLRMKIKEIPIVRRQAKGQKLLKLKDLDKIKGGLIL